MSDFAFPRRGFLKKEFKNALLIISDDTDQKACRKQCFQANISSKDSRLKAHVIQCSRTTDEIKREYIHFDDILVYQRAYELAQRLQLLNHVQCSNDSSSSLSKSNRVNQFIFLRNQLIHL